MFGAPLVWTSSDVDRSCAQQQVEGVSRGRWRAAKSWELAIALWNEACDVFHEDGCPPQDAASPNPSADDKTSAVPEPNVPKPQQTSFVDDDGQRYRSHKIHAFEAGLLMGFSASSRRVTVSSESSSLSSASSLSLSPTPSRSFTARSGSRVSRPVLPVVPPSPLAVMDPVEALSRMGVDDPAFDPLPPKQWVVGGVNKFFAKRIDAIDHTLTHHLGQAVIMGSRNVKKLRACIRGVDYVPGPRDVQYADDG
ncbi:hypothetical protein DFH08DRAFT_958926 [Mycena albidolilacea]|uniref:Uncharacterized protein n=1 Tax=Mycena albidolilacea TaxID=1033008 RepID=A0AAD7ET47_9AGAR|nr:hypothetical protein DFH08DRAFT_958926 [Mycena albidolilacea]